jgi:hypothetical protein
LNAYDLQAGSYVKALEQPGHREAVGRYVDAIVAVLAPLRPRSLLEPGVGEATVLREVLSRLDLPPGAPVLGYDISWSRVRVGQGHLASGGGSATLFVGELEAVPLPDHAADVVYTSHAVEPNHGREAEILAELYRVAGRHLVLFEPSYELGSAEAQARMASHGYCRGLRETAERMGWKVAAHHLLSDPINPLNPTAALVLEKRPGEGGAGPPVFACPCCRGPLLQAQGAHFCVAEGLAFPTLRGIPCLARHNAILASRFLDV